MSTAAAQSVRGKFSVSSLTMRLKQVIEGGFSNVCVEAEISGCRRYPSGHVYFTLKDSGAQISAVMFASAFQRCPVRDSLKDGAKVTVYGSVSVYPPRGNYQLIVTKAELAGQGDLMQRYLELKAKLESEGLFDRSRKRQLPFLPRRIGIVTSEAGAVIHDMCNVIFRRFPGIVVRLYPSLVQGAEAPAELTAGIKYFQSAFNPDLIIIARGGGSFEDLFCFNDETLVRAVAASSVPVISAVGHETDYTLCDFAADVRAGTPSIAAEIAVPKKDELISRLAVLRRSLAMRLSAKWQWFAQRIDQLSDSLSSSLTVAGERSRSRLDRVVPRLSSALKVGLVKAEAGLGRASAKLHALSPYSVLERGYSLTTAEDGSVVKDASTLSEGTRIRTRFRHGEAESVVVA